MSESKQLFVPDKIRVGFQNRKDTYTGKLAYVIYYDKKGKLRKETSWESWRDSSIDPLEVDNTPTEGFVLNRDVGGARHSYGWNPRNEYIRVYDPRDFEFEISLPNLLFILKEGDCSRGKGLHGQFVYSWDGTSLVLLPVASQNYKDCMEFSDLQGKKVAAKDLIRGAGYLTKRQETLIYLGRFDRFRQFNDSRYDSRRDQCSNNLEKCRDKRHVFWDVAGKEFVFPSGMSSISVCSSEEPVSNYAELVEKYAKSPYGSPVAELLLEDAPPEPDDSDLGQYSTRRYEYACENGSNHFTLYHKEISFWRNREHRFCADDIVHLENGIVVYESCYGRDSDRTYHDKKRQQLWAVLESGSKFLVGSSHLIEPKTT